MRPGWICDWAERMAGAIGRNSWLEQLARVVVRASTAHGRSGPAAESAAPLSRRLRIVFTASLSLRQNRAMTSPARIWAANCS
ncbi:hypothetical protein [uncultured Acetatifactor sp.]|uniref:hypothetical protein n=1 Tax=uncultured Acetatifactor sp. TaxID=1671927 RepID=UPI0026351A42|nr:hypothetical protein [uncultured Acetatifactor sp.]